jgi:hypothetical protein
MGLASSLLWWGGMLLLAVALGRMTWSHLLTRYPFFSVYLAAVFCRSPVLLSLRPVTSDGYRAGYWISEFLCAMLAFGVTWEIYARTLSPYPGVRRMARTLMSILLAIMGAKALVEICGSPLHNMGSTVLEFERDLRVVQMLLLLGLMGLVAHYALPMGKNVLSILVGYGLYLGVRVVLLTALVRSGLLYNAAVSLILQAGWNLAVVIWCVGMSSHSEAPAPDHRLECDYERASERTIRAMGQLRSHLVHSWRSS